MIERTVNMYEQPCLEACDVARLQYVRYQMKGHITLPIPSDSQGSQDKDPQTPQRGGQSIAAHGSLRGNTSGWD